MHVASRNAQQKQHHPASPHGASTLQSLLPDAVCVIYCLIVFYGISVQTGNVP